METKDVKRKIDKDEYWLVAQQQPKTESWKFPKLNEF